MGCRASLLPRPFNFTWLVPPTYFDDTPDGRIRYKSAEQADPKILHSKVTVHVDTHFPVVFCSTLQSCPDSKSQQSCISSPMASSTNAETGHGRAYGHETSLKANNPLQSDLDASTQDEAMDEDERYLVRRCAR